MRSKNKNIVTALREVAGEKVAFQKEFRAEEIKNP
jgi:hypothetical protein